FSRQYFRFLLMGGQFRPAADGAPAEPAPVNFKTKAVHWLVAGRVGFLLVPLFFVESRIGFIPCAKPKEFSHSTAVAQYLRGFNYNLVTIINSKLHADAPLPAGMPVAIGSFWSVAVPTLVALLDIFSLFAL